MSEDQPKQSFEKAEERVSAALNRLESSLRSLNGRVRSINRITADVQKLEDDRARLSSELNGTRARANRLDEAAGDVSLRLVTAMETVRAAMEQSSSDEDSEAETAGAEQNSDEEASNA